MEIDFDFLKLEKFIVRDGKILFTTISYVMILVILINLNFILSPAIGIPASIVYFLINGIFLGHSFFENQDIFPRFLLGSLLLVVFLGIAAWAVMIIYNLDAIRSAIVLCIVTTLCSVLNRRTK